MARRDRNHHGYVIVLLAGSVITLLLLAAMAVDVAFWHQRKVHLRRSAEAAAMAGVVYLPGDKPAAKAAARRALLKNDCDVNNTDRCDAEFILPKSEPDHMEVKVTDHHAPVFFAGIAGVDPSITQSATAVYKAPIDVGSPENRLGIFSPALESSSGSAVDHNYWLAVNGWCSDALDGDPVLGAFKYNNGTDGWLDTNLYPTLKSVAAHTYAELNGAYPCGGDANQLYDPTGYKFAVDATGATSNVDIQVYDPGFNATNCPKVANASTIPNATLRTMYEQFNAGVDAVNALKSATRITGDRNAYCPFYTNASSMRLPQHVTTTYKVLDDGANPVDDEDDGQGPAGDGAGATSLSKTYCSYGTRVWDPGVSIPGTDCNGSPGHDLNTTFGKWVTIASVAPGDRYVVYVSTYQGEAESRTVNAFAMRASAGGGAFTPCLATSGPLASACPRVSGVGRLPIFIDDQGNSVPKFFAYVAYVPPINVGRQMTISIYDPDHNIEWIRPMGPGHERRSYVKSFGSDRAYDDEPNFLTRVAGCNIQEPVVDGLYWSNNYNWDALRLMFDLTAKYNNCVAVPGASYSCNASAPADAADSCWWQLEYKKKSTTNPLTDREMWTISVAGDPVYIVK